MKKLLYVFIAFITLSSCKKDKNENPLIDQKWEMVSSKWKYPEDSDDKFYENYNINTNNFNRYLQLKKDNSATLYYKENDDDNIYFNKKTTFTINENQIITDVFYSDGTITYTIDGDILTIKVMDKDYIEIIVFRKSNIDLGKAIEDMRK